jgi:hypothetical protein
MAKYRCGNVSPKKWFRFGTFHFSAALWSRRTFKGEIATMRYTTGAGRMSGKSPSSDDPNAQIAVKLKALYQSVQEEAIPARFLDLLEKLEAAEQQSALQGKE